MKKFLIPLSLLFLLTGCSIVPNNGKTEEPKTPENNEEQGEESVRDVYSKTVLFYNGGFTSSTLDREASQQQFISWFNGDDDLLDSIGYTAFAQLNNFEGKTEGTFSTLVLGNSSGGGGLKFNFKYNVVSVKVSAQLYTKYILYNDTWSTDNNSKFYLESDEYDLSTEANYKGATEKHDYTKTFDPVVKSVSINSVDGRVFVHSMEIKYTK